MVPAGIVPTPGIPALGRQRQEDLCGFEVSLVYKIKLQDSQDYIERPCLKNQNQKIKTRKDNCPLSLSLSAAELRHRRAEGNA